MRKHSSRHGTPPAVLPWMRWRCSHALAALRLPSPGRRDLQSALHLAQEGGAWQPEWQLQQGLPPLPAPMVGLQRMLHHLLRIVWAALLLACTGGTAAGSGEGGGSSGGAAEDCALAATNLLCMAVQRKRADLAAMVAGQAAAPGAPPLPESWRSPRGFRAKCEEHLAGAPPGRPGILYLLRVLAGAERWVDGSRREASWELQRCAEAAAAETAALLAEARQAAPAYQAPAAPHAAEAAAGEGQPAAAGVAATGGEPASAAQPRAGGEPVAAADEQQASPAGEGAARKKAVAKARQQQMLARMRAQQAKAAAALLEEAAEEDAEGDAAEAGGGPTAMAVDAGGEAAAAAAPLHKPPLPAHHPAAWEAHAGAECALCKSGSEAAPLGFVAQLQVTQLLALAAADPATPLTPEHPGVCGGTLGAAPEGGSEPPTFPLGGAGPRLSLFDRQPSLHLLCCGHMLHASCLDSYRWAAWLRWPCCPAGATSACLLHNTACRRQPALPGAMAECFLAAARPAGPAGASALPRASLWRASSCCSPRLRQVGGAAAAGWLLDGSCRVATHANCALEFAIQPLLLRPPLPQLQASTCAPSAAAWATACCRLRRPRSREASPLPRRSRQCRWAARRPCSSCASCWRAARTTGQLHQRPTVPSCCGSGRLRRSRAAPAPGWRCRCSWCRGLARRRQA